MDNLYKGRCSFLQAAVLEVDFDERTLKTTAGDIGYEYLVLAPGSVPALPPADLSPYLLTFWSLADAISLRSMLAERWRASLRRRSAASEGFTVAVVGGGTTGVELSAELASLFRYLKARSVKGPRLAPRVLLLESEKQLMGWLEPYFHDVALQELGKLGIEVRLGTPVESADEIGVWASGERLPAHIRIWTGGVEAAPLVRSLPGEHDRTGRVRVGEHLTLQDHPGVYVIGDTALYEHSSLGSVPPTASAAVQQGPFVARDLDRRLRGSKPRPPFSYFNRGYVVSLGPGNAVANIAGRKLRGPAAQTLYRSIFLYYLEHGRRRMFTASDWAMERILGRLGFNTANKS